jgi:hypothetical protein
MRTALVTRGVLGGAILAITALPAFAQALATHRLRSFTRCPGAWGRANYLFARHFTPPFYPPSGHKWAAIEPHLAKVHTGRRRVDDWRVVSGILYRFREGCRWRSLPPEYGPYTTVFNRWNRWSQRGLWGPPCLTVAKGVLALLVHTIALLVSGLGEKSEALPE